MSTLYPTPDSFDSATTKASKPARPFAKTKPSSPAKMSEADVADFWQEKARVIAPPPWATTRSAPVAPPDAQTSPFTAAQVANMLAAQTPPPFSGPQGVILPPIAPPQAGLMPPPAPAKRLPSLKAFISSDVEIEGSEWTNDLIAECLAAELWRARDIDEIVREGDIMCTEGDGTVRYERISGWKDMTITQEQVDLHGFTIFTLEGAGKPRKPIVIRLTTDFPDGLMSVPKGMQLKLPTEEAEAKRFFGCEVVITELIEKGRPVKCFYPVPQRMSDNAFRRAFSRVFPDFAKKHFREYIKGLIHGRGEGIRLKRGLSLKKLVRLSQAPYRKEDTHTPMTPEQLAVKVNMPVDVIQSVLAKQDYQRLDRPVMPFVQRMEARALTPNDFGYDKGLGIEIETITPLKHEDAQKKVPSYVRCAQDGSIRDHAGNKPNGNGVWGIEYRILIKRSELETRVLKAVEAISGIGAQVNKSCGLHVHFDMRDKSKVEAAAIHERMSKWVSVLRELVPPSRRDNQYCRFENADSDHHKAVSFGSYDKHKTIEVRVHSATLNNTKIIQWVRLMEATIEAKFLPLAKTSTLDGLKMLNLTEADRTFWLKRHQQLNPNMYKGGHLDLSFLGTKADEIE